MAKAANRSITRRSFLHVVAGTAAVDAALATPVADPVLALIEAHRRADAAHRDAVERYNAIEDAVPFDKRAHFLADREIGVAAQLAAEVELQFLVTRPTTIAGTVALLRHVVTHSLRETWPDHRVEIPGFDDERDEGRWATALFHNVADALEAIARP